LRDGDAGDLDVMRARACWAAADGARRAAAQWHSPLEQGCRARELGQVERVGLRVGNRKERGEVGCGRCQPDKVLKFENGFPFILT
jgi:hypothetical protein